MTDLQQHKEALALCYEAINNLLPGARHTAADVGLINEAMMAAKRLSTAETPETSPVPDDSLRAKIGDVGNQLHNLSCEHQNNEALSDQLSALSIQLWDLAREASPKPSPSQREALEALDRFGSAYDGCGGLWQEDENLIRRFIEQAGAVPEGCPEAFVEWLRREIPANTVISDPDWWAPRIYRAVLSTAPTREGSDGLL